MNIAQRKQRAIEHLRELKDQGREEREWAEEELAQQALDDNAENALRAEAHPLSNAMRKPPNIRRAEASVRELLRERDEAMSPEDEVRLAFGIGADEAELTDDEEDFLG